MKFYKIEYTTDYGGMNHEFVLKTELDYDDVLELISEGCYENAEQYRYLTDEDEENDEWYWANYEEIDEEEYNHLIENEYWDYEEW